MTDWDLRFLELARFVASWSKDPSSKIGAVIVNDKRIVVGLGFNGFPRGVKDLQTRLDTRELKLKYVVHAEVNAILNSNGPVHGCILYVWGLPFCCHECTKFIIQAGIKRVVLPNAEIPERWRESADYSDTMFQESGVIVSVINIPVNETLN